MRWLISHVAPPLTCRVSRSPQAAWPRRRSSCPSRRIKVRRTVTDSGRAGGDGMRVDTAGPVGGQAARAAAPQALPGGDRDGGELAGAADSVVRQGDCLAGSDAVQGIDRQRPSIDRDQARRLLASGMPACPDCHPGIESTSCDHPASDVWKTALSATRAASCPPSRGGPADVRPPGGHRGKDQGAQRQGGRVKGNIWGVAVLRDCAVPRGQTARSGWRHQAGRPVERVPLHRHDLSSECSWSGTMPLRSGVRASKTVPHRGHPRSRGRCTAAWSPPGRPNAVGARPGRRHAAAW